MRITKIALGFLLLCLVAASCTRKNDIIVDPSFPIGGKGGRASLLVTPRHHLKNIDSCIIYLAYNSTTFPGRAWDESKKVTVVNGRPIAQFDSLTLGHYFVYAVGLDPEVTTDTIPLTVEGSGPFTILDSTKTYDVFLDVTEARDHVHTPQD